MKKPPASKSLHFQHPRDHIKTFMFLPELSAQDGGCFMEIEQGQSKEECKLFHMFICKTDSTIYFAAKHMYSIPESAVCCSRRLTPTFWKTCIYLHLGSLTYLRLLSGDKSLYLSQRGVEK